MVDTHCHIDRCKGEPADIVAAAVAEGVTRIATVGMDGDTIAAALRIAEAHDEVFAIVGRHPNMATGFSQAVLDEVESAAAHPRARAIGETGLDYYRDYAPRDHQIRAFEAQIDLARRTKLPLVIHTRAAEEDTFAMLREQAGGLTVIMHCFSAAARLEECVERGWFCSFAGNVTYPKAEDLHAAARDVPDELLLVETDSPYLSPQPRRGKPNEPANVRMTAAFVAERRGVSYEELEALVERNAAGIFGW